VINISLWIPKEISLFEVFALLRCYVV